MNLYQQKVLEGRKKFLNLAVRKEKEILSIYEEAAKDISERLSKAKAGSLNQRYLTELQKSVKQYTKELRQELSKAIGEGLKASSEIASNVQLSYFESMDLEEDLLSTFKKMFTQLPIKVVDTMVNGNYYKDGLTLNQRIWNITKRNGKDIDRIINVNIAQGRSAGELAKQLDEYINPNKILNQRTRIPGINKSISYNSARLARTSMTHANTESYIQGSYMNPFCTGLKWNLSSSHYSRQIAKLGPDICDDYAGKIFKPDEYPVAHPNCLCYSTQEVEDTDKARDELIRWVKGENNSKLDKWLYEYGEEFGIERNHSEYLSELAITKDKKNDIIELIKITNTYTDIKDINKMLEDVSSLEISRIEKAELKREIIRNSGFNNFDFQNNLTSIYAFENDYIEVVEFEEEKKLYRRSYKEEHNSKYGIGSWFGDKRRSIEETREELAVLEHWNNPLDASYVIKCPKKTRALKGIAAEQKFIKNGEILESRKGKATQYWLNEIDSKWLILYEEDMPNE